MTVHDHSAAAYRGRLIDVEIGAFTDADGRRHEREIVRHPGAVLIVPVLDDGRLVMIRNHRPAVDERLWEFPAGKLEPGEAPAAAAIRELTEETGYTGTIEPLGEFFTSPGFTDERMHAFTATGLTAGEQQLEPGERIEVEIVAAEEAIAMAVDGRLRDGKSIAALLLWHIVRCSRGSVA